MLINKNIIVLVFLISIYLFSIVSSHTIENCNPKYCLSSVKCPSKHVFLRYPFKCCGQCVQVKDRNCDFSKCGKPKFSCRDDEMYSTDGSSCCPNVCSKK